MNRRRLHNSLDFSGVPRASGDEPITNSEFVSSDLCSPRERG